MRIVNLEQFLAMPPGTLFAKYAPQMFGELCVKGESIPAASDFAYRPLWEVEAGSSNELYIAIRDGEERGSDVEITVDCEQRDGLFVYDQLYAVFSDDEARRIAGALPRWIPVSERLPDKEAPYLIVCDEHGDGSCIVVSAGSYEGVIEEGERKGQGVWTPDYNHMLPSSVVTHWMPLPPPPPATPPAPPT
jgi:hypothetical protein